MSTPQDTAAPPRNALGAIVLPLDAFASRVASELGLDLTQLEPDARLVQDLGFDSLRMCELALVLDALGASLDVEDVERIHRFRDVYRLYVARRAPTRYGDVVCEAAPASWSDEGPAGRAQRSAPPLTSRRTRQRPVVPADYPYLYDLTQIDRVAAFWRHRGESVNPEQFPSLLWRSVLVQHLILDGRSRAPIGFVAAHDADLRNGTAALAIALEPRVHGKGWPFEAAALFVNYMFAMWPLRKLYLEALTPVAQTISSGVGRLFVEEGRLSAHEYLDGAWVDLHVLSIFRDRWEARSPQLIARIVEHPLVRAAAEMAEQSEPVA